ncbi:MAG: glycosyltransferase family 4 protein [Bacteroidetes bacterium]|nr:glycosyltransferase family 4 protein [Bacteroidota bacterium]
MATRKIVVVNQAVNYLTIGLCNAFAEKFEKVDLITGSIHVQGEELNSVIKVHTIIKWKERPASKKLYSYVMGTFQIYWLLLTRFRRHEVFFISLPPMGYLLKLFLRHRFSMLIWDVYPDVFKITGMKESHWFYRLWAKCNKIVFKKAYRLFTIGNRMADLLSVYADRSKILITPIWSIFQKNSKVSKNTNPFIAEHKLQDKSIVQYSGNIGLTHKVETMVQLAEILKDNKTILFQIIGRGPRVPYLQKLVEEKNLHNCVFLPFQTDAMFPYSLSAADLGVVILDETTSKGSVPSKTYNLMSYGIPALFITAKDSELHDYSLHFNNGKSFDSNELEQAAEFIVQLSKDSELQSLYSENSLKAAHDFKRANADKIVELYLAEYTH